ncbi:MAG TPA: xanthine dehydrogenase family protein molybdopterin-binding subunit [Candidatus Binatia bacterium]|nr:xanthine dehydrogenase family protein molybdopterin-binding subunit [Candidatus Binatia bacterium]
MAVGQSISMVDSQMRVAGSIDYTLNFELPRMLHACVLHSPHAHARIVKVDASKAEKLPGVAAVLTRDDLTGDHIDPYFGLIIQDQTPVALDRVRFVGETVAAVAAVDADTAAEAVELINVEYEELPAVFDPEEALRPGAPILHPGPKRIMAGRPDVAARSLEGTNIVHLFKQRKGDMARGFGDSDNIFENTFSSPSVNHFALEPHVTVAQVSGSRITVWTCSQNPHVVQRQLAGILKVPIADVRIVVSTLGGGFGGKLNSKMEPAAVLLAKKTGRPVRLVARRAECFLLGVQHECKIKLKTGVKRDGTLVAVEAYCYYNSGAYGDTTPNLITRGYAAIGPYRVPHLQMDSYGVYTNTPPSAAFRGYGITQVAWAHETQMDIIADALGLDPLDLRLKNVLQKGDTFSTGEPMPEMHYNELIAAAAEKIGWKDGPLVLREGNRIRAKGIGVIIKGMATPTTSTATVKLNSDGSLNVLTSSVEMGQGLKTALAQIAATEIGLPVQRVRVSEPDTAFTPFDLMTAASRATFCMGTAIRDAIKDIREQLLEAAAAQLEAAKEDLVLQDGQIMVRGVTGKSVSYADAIRFTKENNLLGHGVFVSGSGPDGSPVVMDFETGQGYGSAEWHPAVVVCEVAVDTDTGKVEVTKLHAELYAGKVINPLLSELQVQGATIFGLGQVLFEELAVDTNGNITNPNLSDYMIPSFEDVPPQLTVHLLEPHGVTEVHGIGETAIPPARPAIGNAISRAVGTHFLDLPTTPEKILRALERQKIADA